MHENPDVLRIELINKKPRDAFQGYHFYHINQNFNQSENQHIIQKIKDSKIVFIDTLDDNKKDMYIGLNKTVIYVQNSSEQLLMALFSKNLELKFFFQENKKDILNKIINIPEDKIFQFTTKLQLLLN